MTVPPHTGDAPLLLTDAPPQLVVDVSNVCRDTALGASSGRAVWERFVRVMEAWRSQRGGVPQGVAIADENLRFLLTDRDRSAFQAAERAGVVRSVPGSADREILRLAERHRACVLSRDNFRGHRRRHSWIQGCSGRFFTWELDRPDGAPTIVPRDMGHTSPFSLSRHGERDDLRDRGLDARRTTDRELLAHAYRCTNDACLTASLHPDRLLVPPERRGGEPRCPSCGGPLADLGPRPTTVKLVVEHDGKKLLERALEEGQRLDLGREDVAAAAGDPRVKYVSRPHLRLELRDGRLWACDLRSHNGTQLIRWDARRGVQEDAATLGLEPTALGERDVLVLPGTVRVRRSGERFAIADPEPARAPRPRGSRTTAERLRETP